MSSVEVIKKRLHEAGCRATSSRIAILDLLWHDKTHPGVEDVYERVRERLPGISLSTVYETIDRFVELGLCQRVEGPGQPTRIDGNADVHVHARCVVCGRIIDLPEDAFPPPPLPDHPVEGIRMHAVQVMFEGRCDHCSSG